MAKLSKQNFDFYKGCIKDDKSKHKCDMLDLNVPENIIAAYEGLLSYGNTDSDDLFSAYGSSGESVDRGEVSPLVENHLFIAVQTLLPSLYYQVPQPNITARPNGSTYSAEVLNGLARHYFDDKCKHENQLAIIDAFLPFGYGVVKCGYNSRIGIQNNQKPSLITGKTKGPADDRDMESSTEYVKYERPFIERVSPRFTFLDSTKPFGKGQRVTFCYKRTVQEIVDSNLYNIDQTFIKYFGQKEEDKRKVELTLKEHWCMIDGYAWKLVYVEEWPEELYWGKTPYKWLPYSLLRFVKTPDRLYARSHGCLATSSQRELNYLNEIWKEHVDKTKRQHMVDMSGLTENGKKVLKSNEIDGVIECTRPPGNVYQQISSNPMGQDVYANIQNVRSYMQQLLSAAGAVGGEADSKTATQERMVAMGNQQRASGLQDAIRDFNNDQLRKMITMIVNWGDPEVTVTITGKEAFDPFNGMLVTGQDLVIGGDEGVSLQAEIIGDLEADYQYEIDVASAARPDQAIVRKQLIEYGTWLGNVSPLMQAQGAKVNWLNLSRQIGNTFDNIANPESIVEEMSPEEMQQMQMQQAMQQQQDTLQAASEPTEEAMIQGAEQTQI